MTDDTIRPKSDPSRESEPRHPEEQAVDDAVDEIERPGDPDDAAEENRGAAGPADATAGNVDEVETVAGERFVTEVTSEEPDTATEPPVEDDVVETAAEIPDTGVDPAVEEPRSTELGDTEGESSTAATADGAAQPADDATGANGGANATPTEATDTAERVVAAATVPADDTAVRGARDEVFVWHPDHKGKSFDEVRAALAQDIAADQRQHRLAMDGAEESEHEALASVVSLERKWGTYDFDWAEQEPDDLAGRIVAFERERERRQELISWADYRNADADVDDAEVAGERPAELSTSAKGLSLLLVVLLIVVILLAVWAL